VVGPCLAMTASEDEVLVVGGGTGGLAVAGSLWLAGISAASARPPPSGSVRSRRPSCRCPAAAADSHTHSRAAWLDRRANSRAAVVGIGAGTVNAFQGRGVAGARDPAGDQHPLLAPRRPTARCRLTALARGSDASSLFTHGSSASHPTGHSLGRMPNVAPVRAQSRHGSAGKNHAVRAHKHRSQSFQTSGSGSALLQPVGGSAHGCV
jgi:hypothetical protein